MLPATTTFPKFVPDQLLTSDNLNQLFGYLDEQGRMTRTNLIGIGIVCGLELENDANGTSITITKGCGVTSEGYLITVPSTTYSEYKDFDAVKERYYDKFVNISTKQQRFPLWELKQAGVDADTTPLNNPFLQDKVVLLFVELLEEGNKNCNPNSCDDKGVTVTVTFRPLLVLQKDAESLIGISSGAGINLYPLLPDIPLHRYDVTATLLIDTKQVVEGFLKLFADPFLPDLEQSLTNAYNLLQPFVGDEYNTNPFTGFATHFSFLTNGTITPQQLLNVQYYYDLFSDIIQAYNELRITASEVISLCAPDSGLFPRHLLLGEAIGYSSKIISHYRHYFISSPAITNQGNLSGKLRFLFRRIVLLIADFTTTISNNQFSNRFDNTIRITPSKLGEAALSNKAIPFYYTVNATPNPLYKNWNYFKEQTGQSHRNLSYHADLYNTSDDDIRRPLLYDLESYNFFRIEGHIGKPFKNALSVIETLKRQYRLPFEVVALNADIKNLIRQILSLKTANAETLINTLGINPEVIKCHFNDLEALYDASVAELTCVLCGEMQYFYNEPPNGNPQFPPLPSNVPKVPLLVKCAPDFRVTNTTIGHGFELFYATIANQPYIAPSSFFVLTGNFNVSGLTTFRAADPNLLAYMLLYYMEKLYETLSDNLGSFDIVTFHSRYTDLLQVANYIKSVLKATNSDDQNERFFREDVIDHLDAIIYACRYTKFLSIYQEYLSRWIYLLYLQSFAYYAWMNPGINHKSGVSVGGTFILVYHQKGDDRLQIANPAIREENIFTRATQPANAGEKTNNIHATIDEANFHANATLNNNATAFELKDVINRIVNKVGSAALQASINGAITSDEGQPERTTIDEIIDELSDGIVIADFYLPYLCCSDCPPVQFIINEKGTAEGPTIDMDKKEFCSDDKDSYDINVTPEGGTISGEGVSDANGKKAFTPAAVNLAKQMNKVVELSYAVNGQTATLQVKVYQKPKAAFSFNQQPDSTKVQFKNESVFAEKANWDFGNNQTTTEENPVHDFTNAGNYSVTLQATNGPCSDTNAQPVEVIAPVVKTCLPLADIAADFNGIMNLQPDDRDPGTINEFRDAFAAFDSIQRFFKQAENVVNQPVDAQLDFFKQVRIKLDTSPANNVTVGIAEALETWLNALFFNFIIEATRFRLLALCLYRVLVNLAQYLACIQKEDIDKAAINLTKVWEVIMVHLNRISVMVPNMSDREKEQLKKMQEAFGAELGRVVSNGEESTKPKYVEALKTALHIMEGFNL